MALLLCVIVKITKSKRGQKVFNDTLVPPCKLKGLPPAALLKVYTLESSRVLLTRPMPAIKNMRPSTP